ncbi:MAG: hypothetical protein AAF696_24460 [Bacteroidota bacterium]
MKRLRNILLGLLLLMGLIYFLGINYLNSGSKEPDNSVWQSYIGRDTSVGILPDQYANYFTYTLAHTYDNLGFRIKGKFPDTRYFSFNVYSLGDNTTQGSLVDYQITPDDDMPNPFLVNKDSVEAGENYTVYLVPEKYKHKDLPNVLAFRNDVNLLSMVIRMYDYNIDDQGGVELPTVEAFKIEESKEDLKLEETNLPLALNLRTIVRNFSLPKMVERLSLLYETESEASLLSQGKEQAFTALPFHAIDSRGFIENNDNRYLLAGISKEEEEVYLFRFKSPTYTTGPENINQTEVRYWSFNLGNAASYNFNALKDEDALLDSAGFVNIVLASADEEIEKRCEELGYNFLEWNMPWKEALILFRHMLANPDFEAQIDDVPPIKEGMDAFAETEASLYLGEYAPRGMRMSKEDFLSSYRIE